MAKFFNNWSELTGRARASLIIGVVVIAALTLWAFFWLTGEEYQVLFADLEPRDAAKVVAELERMKVDYSLGESGSQIRVPQSTVHEVRLKLMGAGVPLVGGVGFEIFDDSDFGMTEFAQRINYQRALEGELTRTVMSLQEVKYARLHLVMPERGIFQKDDEPPSASVTLFLHTGRRPVAQQILGIQRLVAAAVPGLRASRVTVTDQDGMTLSRPIPDQDGAATVSGRLEQKRDLEEYLTEKVQEMLNRNFGARQAMVSVDAVLDFNQVSRTREKVLPLDGRKENGILRRRETRTGSGSSSKDAGNVMTDVEYRLGRDIEQVVETPGKIVRLSVGVMVPPQTPEGRREEIRELVKMAVGFDATRGDAIAVYAMSKTGDVPLPHISVGVGQPTVAASDKQDGEDLLAVERKKSESPSSPSRLYGWIVRYPMGTGALATAIVMCVLFAGLNFLRHGSRAVQPTLSEAERERVLANIRNWLNDADESIDDKDG